MWDLDYKESWAPKNCYFWTMVLEKTLKSPLDCKEIKPVSPKGNQSWVFIGRTDFEAETPILWPPDGQLIHWKRPWCWERLKAGREREDRGWDRWMAPTQWIWIWTILAVGDGQGTLACCSPWGHKEWTQLSDWTELIVTVSSACIKKLIKICEFLCRHFRVDDGSILCFII